MTCLVLFNILADSMLLIGVVYKKKIGVVYNVLKLRGVLLYMASKDKTFQSIDATM